MLNVKLTQYLLPNISAIAGRTCLRALLCFMLGMAGIGKTYAQQTDFRTIARQFDQYRKKALQEKLFLHLDRPVYTCGETMWFKVYDVDGTLHRPLDISKVAYVEVLDASGKPVLQGKIPMQQGTGNGSFVLPATLTSGNYVVRAYTNWMKNFSPELYFEQPVTIINTFQKLQKQEAVANAGYTIQFFPEGGSMLAGVANKVAFKAVDNRTGNGIDFTGEVQDQQGNKVADIKPHKFGMGHFTFTPAPGEKYTAVVRFAENRGTAKVLPVAYGKGYTIKLDDAGSDKLRLTVHQAGQPDDQVYLLGHTRQQIAMAEAATVNQGTAVFVVDKNALADGITHFTVFNQQKKPVCERLYFKYPTQALQLSIATDKPLYSTREKVALNILANATTGKGAANLSMAVYRLDSLQAPGNNSIESYLWLTSDLKGTIENPGYYFTEAGKTDLEAIDNLMLTHGWSRFKWEDILDNAPADYTFIPEYGGHWITGKVTYNKTGAPAPGVVTYLGSPSRHIRLYNATSDSSGLIRYEVKDFFGQRDIVVQSDYSKDSTYHFEIFSPFSDKYSGFKLPQFNLSEQLQQEITLRHVQTQVQQAYFGNYTNRFLPAGVDSIPFYGTASERYLLDDYKRFKVMEEVMREYVPGVMVRRRKGKFHFMVFNKPHRSVFEEDPMVLLDGVPVFDVDKIMAFDPLKVKKLEVVTSRFFSGPRMWDGLVSYTTYTGNLAGFELDSRALLQEYEGLQLQREFYAPAYETDAQKQSRLADIRNLLYWAPELKLETGKDQQTIFYTSDQPGTYLVVVQGLTSDGLAGSKTLTFRVGRPI